MKLIYMSEKISRMHIIKWAISVLGSFKTHIYGKDWKGHSSLNARKRKKGEEAGCPL